MGVHLCGRCLQPRQNAESGLYASSFSISLGRSESKRQKTGVWIAEFLQKRSDLKPNSPAQAVGRGTSSRQPSFFRILLEDENSRVLEVPLWMLDVAGCSKTAVSKLAFVSTDSLRELKEILESARW